MTSLFTPYATRRSTSALRPPPPRRRPQAMNALRATRAAARATPAVRAASRRGISSTKPRLGGDGHDHNPPLYSPPYAKGTTALIVGGVLGVGCGGVYFLFAFQNKKHGFSK
mmetsp:Transcript_15465/g.52444  ORF Transcript_15465/g.52444 Transcript_15465/m.52444 type:complete len:112 (-) Transcript_15465:259-594(-)